MTITSFETGSVFRIIDQFSEPLRKLIGGLTEADATIKQLTENMVGFGAGFEKASKTAMGSLSLLNADILEKTRGWGLSFDAATGGWAKSFDVASNSMIASLARVNEAMTATTARMEAMSARSAEAAIGSRLPGSGPFGRAKHSSGPHFGRYGTEIPGGHVSIGGTPLLAGAGILGYGVYEAAQLQDEVTRMLLTGQVKPADFGMTGAAMSTMIMNAASSTGFSTKDVAESLIKGERSLQGLDLTQKLATTQTLLPYAAAEARLKETSLAESLESMIGMAHMTGTYDPAKLKDLAKSFSFASLATNATLPQFERTLSYSMPELRATMGIDPDVIMAMTATMQNAGITSSKSGTWLRSYFENIEPMQGTDPTSIKHNQALQKLGLLDDQNNVLWRKKRSDGSTDWLASAVGMSSTLREHLENMPEDQRINAVRGVLGERGGAAGSMLSMKTFVEQFATLADKLKSWQGGSDAIEEYAKNSTVQKARETWRDTQNILIDIGEKELPTVNRALHELDDMLKADNPIAKLSTDLRNWLKGGLDGILNPGDAHKQFQEQRNKFFHPTAFGDEGSGGGMTGAVRDGFLQAFAAIKGMDFSAMGGAAAGGGIINAAYFGTGSTGSAAGGGTGATPGGSTFGMVAAGGAVDTAMRLQGYGSRQVAQALGARMTNGEWCADFVNGALKANGIAGSGSSAAMSFARWGTAVDLGHIMKGDVAFENHGGGHGHAMLLTGERDGRGWLGVVSGNHGGRVDHYWENPSHIAGIRRGIPSVGPPPQARAPSVIHNHIHLDKQIVASSVTRMQANRGRFPTSVGSLDAHGSFASPGTPFIDAA